MKKITLIIIALSSFLAVIVQANSRNKLTLNCSISTWEMETNYEIYTDGTGNVLAGNALGENAPYRVCEGNLVMMLSESPVTNDKDCSYFRSAEHQELFLSKVNLDNLEVGKTFVVPYNLRLNGIWNETAVCERVQ